MAGAFPISSAGFSTLGIEHTEYNYFKITIR